MSQQTTTGSTSTHDLYFDQARLQTIQEILCARIDDVFDKLEVGFLRTSRMYYGCCPIHGGDNNNAFNLYHGGEVPGKWVCRTKHCENTFKKTVIGFIRGVLSHHKYNWPTTPKTASFKEAIDWCCEFIGQKLRDIKVDREEMEKRLFVSNISSVTRKPEKTKSGITRAQVRSRLAIPAKYFMSRGWSQEVLDKYDAGLCIDSTKPMYDRIVVPIYDDSYRYVIGCTARSVFDKCRECGMWHNPGLDCPNEQYSLLYSKWRNSEGFAREKHLYNWWFAQKPIQTTGVAVLCEGPGDLWRLTEAGIDCGLAMFGNELTDQQQILLEMSGAMSLIVVTNMDEAGRYGAEQIKKRLYRSYRLYFPELPKKDLGEMGASEVRSLISPLIDKVRRRS